MKNYLHAGGHGYGHLKVSCSNNILDESSENNQGYNNSPRNPRLSSNVELGAQLASKL